MRFSRILKQSWKEKKTTKSQFPKCENVDLAVKVGVMCRLDPSGGHHLIARPGVKFKFSQTETQKNQFHWWVSKPNIANAQQTRQLSAFAKVIANNINNNLWREAFSKLWPNSSNLSPNCQRAVVKLTLSFQLSLMWLLPNRLSTIFTSQGQINQIWIASVSQFITF